jgi:hypothetical protein
MFLDTQNTSYSTFLKSNYTAMFASHRPSKSRAFGVRNFFWPLRSFTDVQKAESSLSAPVLRHENVPVEVLADGAIFCCWRRRLEMNPFRVTNSVSWRASVHSESLRRTPDIGRRLSLSGQLQFMGSSRPAPLPFEISMLTAFRSTVDSKVSPDPPFPGSPPSAARRATHQQGRLASGE